MQRAEKEIYHTIQEDEITVRLVIFKESVFLNEDKRGIEVSFDDIDLVFKPSEFKRMSNYDIVKDGVGGTCDWCNSDCEESVFLDMEFSFVTLHPACYTHVQDVCSNLYEKYKADVLNFRL